MHIYFHMRVGETLVEDPEGSFFSSVEEARREAVQAARDIVAEQIRSGRPVGTRSFELTSAAGDLLLTLSFDDAVRSR